MSHKYDFNKVSEPSFALCRFNTPKNIFQRPCREFKPKSILLVDPCKDNPCENGGQCLSNLHDFTYFCKCPEEYEGDSCETKGKN